MNTLLPPGSGVEVEIRAPDTSITRVTSTAKELSFSAGGAEVRIRMPAAAETARAEPAPASSLPPTRRSPDQAEPAAEVEVHTPPPDARRPGRG